MADFDIKKIAIYEPRLNVGNEREWVIVKGGQTVTVTGYPATSNSNNNFVFTTNPPGKKNVLDRHIYIKVPVTLTFTGPGLAPGTDLMVQQGRDAFRSYPISSITSTLQCKINGFPVTVELDKIIHLLENFHSKVDVQNTFQSIYPNMTDNYQIYSDGDISNRNPLGSYSDNPAVIPRGAYNMQITNNTNTTATVTAELWEQIVLPPFLFDDSQAGGLVNLDTLEFNFTLAPQLARIWSRSTANTVPLSNLTVDFNKPTLYLNWITPRDTQFIPDRVRYPYFQISKYIQSNNGNVAPNANASLSSQVIQLNSIPRKIYIFAKLSDTVINQTFSSAIKYPDTFFKINNISISWDNIDGILSGSSDVNLYEMSVNNGLNYDWVSWNGITTNYGTTIPQNNTKIGLKGSIICLCPGVDFGLRNSQAEGVIDKINFQVTALVTNVNQAETLTPDLYVVAVYDGFLEIYDNQCKAIIGAVTNEDILATPVTYDVSYHEIQKIYGGDFFSKIRDTGSKVLKGLTKANDYLRDKKLISNVLGAIPSPYTQSAAQVAKSFGYGKGGVLMGGCCNDQNCDCSGGAMASKRKMMKRLRNN